MMRRSPAKIARSREQITDLIVPENEAREKISKQIEEATKLISMQITNEGELQILKDAVHSWFEFTKELLRRLFNTSEVAEEFSRAFGSVVPRSILSEQVEYHKSFVRNHLTLLKAIEKKLSLYSVKIASLAMGTHGKADAVNGSSINPSVFLVHGHDNDAKETVARLLTKLDVNVIILHEQASQGKTIIEKFEHHSNVVFAVVLLTPDDVGAERSQTKDLNPRARQNVVLELGYFIGKLGRRNVVALKKGDVEVPSDLDGIIYVPLDEGGNWRFKLAQEMSSAGLNVDLNKLLD